MGGLESLFSNHLRDASLFLKTTIIGNCAMGVFSSALCILTGPFIFSSPTHRVKLGLGDRQSMQYTPVMGHCCPGTDNQELLI